MSGAKTMRRWRRLINRRAFSAVRWGDCGNVLYREEKARLWARVVEWLAAGESVEAIESRLSLPSSEPPAKVRETLRTLKQSIDEDRARGV